MCNGMLDLRLCQYVYKPLPHICMAALICCVEVVYRVVYAL